MDNPVRKALLELKPTIGTWIQIGHPAVAEALATAGFDWIAADMEHTDIDNAAFANLARGMHGRGPVPLARVGENDTLAIRQLLDLGAQGVIVPLVHTPEDAERAVAAAKYPPRGVRGYCFSRMNDWGKDFETYAAEANDNIAVVVMIESKQGVENIDAILAVDGVDGVFIGPYDLSGSCGVPGQTSHPDVQAGCQTVLEACKKAGKAAGLHVVMPDKEAIAKAVADGFTFVAVGVDTVFLANGANEAVQAAKE
ncbi:MAG: aldolase/citrate lyase family protein [Kiritimatiellia bacterium]|jgi:2-keto-3-deoxy-L-rhamnonate aldolase RhmA|nr:aldolase/citrate lyase family protein [Kiritimatiellia bacterium]